MPKAQWTAPEKKAQSTQYTESTTTSPQQFWLERRTLETTTHRQHAKKNTAKPARATSTNLVYNAGQPISKPAPRRRGTTGNEILQKCMLFSSMCISGCHSNRCVVQHQSTFEDASSSNGGGYSRRNGRIIGSHFTGNFLLCSCADFQAALDCRSASCLHQLQSHLATRGVEIDSKVHLPASHT